MAASQNLTADGETQQKKSAQETLLAQTTFAQATFDPSFLINTPGSNVDVKRYENGNVVIPGQYTLDTFLSGTSIGNEPVEIRVDNGHPRGVL
ncbi:FimD/PapC N-terminal domain-containing protein [Paraburkholderia xenovorans]